MMKMMMMALTMMKSMMMTHSGPGFWVVSQALLLLYFYFDNGSNVCGIEFNYSNEEGNSDYDDSKSILGADESQHEDIYNGQIFRQLFGLGFEVESEEGR